MKKFQNMNDERELSRRTEYLKPVLDRSIAFALRGPRSLPRFIRRLPLNAVFTVYRYHLFLMRF